ncbi:MAG: SDR family NAD(P)-dependent oxidoreductase, partial [Actinomycetota bacterium]|nr:SDR family NAD(P)-dependent oxidoreductase [Actinomycetota bacterium]
MDLELGGKVAWVLGGSSGLGRACALALAREGASVAISSRREDKLKQVASEIGDCCVPVPLDVTDAAAIDRAATEIASRLGPVDILVVNAGGPPAGTFDDFDDRALHEAFELTAASAWRLA